MGFLDFIRGIKRPKTGVVPVIKEELMNKLLSLNREKRPYQITKAEDTDLIAEWKIVDASWYEIFAKAGLKEVYRMRMLLDDSKKEVRCLEETGSVEWSAGIPRISFGASFFRGRVLFSKQFGVGYAFKEEDLKFGKVYEYRFDASEIKKPIVETVTENGWTYVPVYTKRKVSY